MFEFTRRPVAAREAEKNERETLKSRRRESCRTLPDYTAHQVSWLLVVTSLFER